MAYYYTYNTRRISGRRAHYLYYRNSISSKPFSCNCSYVAIVLNSLKVFGKHFACIIVYFTLKILPVYSQGKINDTSIEYSRTYPRWGILQGGECGELVTSERHTGAKECLLWRTPTASDAERDTLQPLYPRWVQFPTIARRHASALCFCYRTCVF